MAIKLPNHNFILLETNRFDKDNYKSFLFTNPIWIISCYRIDDVPVSLYEIEDFISRGYYVSGFISYSAGFAFEEKLKGMSEGYSDFPLVWFGVYKEPVIINHTQKGQFLHNKLSYTIRNLRSNITRRQYIKDVKKIKSFIRKGETYQVNYTFKYKFDFKGSFCSLYEDLKAKQSVYYSALISTSEFSILSLSPELFFRKDKFHIKVMPMKGTIERGKNLKEDEYNRGLLRESLKDRSENIMIVDLLRSDLGRISQSGSVKTMYLFGIERYETLFQMVSMIKSDLENNISFYDLFKAIFPSGSVTGAPKISTMKIINSLEKEGRRIYTGGIGFFAPDGQAVFNVAIRTLLINNKTNKGEMGVGSGIVYDSDPNKEFGECRLKADFITQKKEDFELIETILWRHKTGYFLLGLHIDRISSSAEYFNFGFNRKEILNKLRNIELQFKDGYNYKVRIYLDKEGDIKVSFEVLDKPLQIAKVRFSNKRTYSNNVFLYHKTTNRTLYDEEYKKWANLGYFDIIFTNEKNQVTEGAISNIIIKKEGVYYTPPIDCGLLDGVYRRYLLQKKIIPLKENILYKKDIKNADEIYIVNSVRGMVKAEL